MPEKRGQSARLVPKRVARDVLGERAFGGEQGTEWTLAQSGAIVHAWATSVEVD